MSIRKQGEKRITWRWQVHTELNRYEHVHETEHSYASKHNTDVYVNKTRTLTVSKLVGALSPVNTKDYIRAEHKTSLYLQVINFTSFTSQYTTSHVFLSLSIFRGHSTWEPASGRVTYFILPAYTGTMC